MLDTLQKAAAAAHFADEVKAEDIVLLDVTGLCSFTDCFVICTASNRVQVNAICDRISQGFRKIGFKGPKEDGNSTSNWIVLDFGDVVIHVMNSEARSFYRLESLWGDAPRKEWEELFEQVALSAPA